MAEHCEVADKPELRGPHELSKGTLTLRPRTITELIPLSTGNASSGEIFYTPDPETDAAYEAVRWKTGHHIMICGGGRILLKEGMVCFSMLVYSMRDKMGDGEHDDKARTVN